MKHQIRKENSGFTLVELIITIAVLAVISVPLLKYFSDSMRHNVRMKEEQNAVVAAQNVLEELKVLDISLDDIGNLTAPPASAPAMMVAWHQQSAPASNPDGSYSYEVKGNYSLNNSSYALKAKITPRKSLTNDNSDTVVYHKAEVPAMDSSNDVIATERNHYLSSAGVHFYGIYTKECENTGTPRSTTIKPSYIQERLKRTIKIKAEPNKDEHGIATGKVDITVSYHYRWNTVKYPSMIAGVTATSEYSETVQKSTLAGTGSHNIFIFYAPIHYKANPTDTIDTVISDQVEIESNIDTLGKTPGTASTELNYKLYLVADGDIARTKPLETSYTLSLSKVSGADLDKYFSDIFTNLKSGEMVPGSVATNGSKFPTASGYGTHYETLMKKPTANRVADIEVSIYKDKGGTPVEADRYTTVKGTKVQQ